VSRAYLSQQIPHIFGEVGGAGMARHFSIECGVELMNTMKNVFVWPDVGDHTTNIAK
jgi:hypothetical protein